MSRDVEIVESPSPQRFQEIIHGSQPVLMRGACASWPAVQRWNIDYLCNAIGDKEVSVRLAALTDFATPKAQTNDFRVRMNIRDYFKESANPTRSDGRVPYFMDDLSEFPALARDIPPTPGIRSPVTSMFIGHNSFTPSHYHPHSPAALCQIAGEKRLVFYAPEQFDNLYPFKWHSSAFWHTSLGDPEKADPERYPLVHKLEPVHCVARAGDIVFIPTFWWHTVYGSEFSIAATHFWAADSWREGLWAPVHPLRHWLSIASHPGRIRTVSKIMLEHLRRIVGRS